MTGFEKFKHLLTQYGIYTHQFRMGIKGTVPMLRDYLRFTSAFRRQRDFSAKSFYPLLADRYDQAGTASGHYFHQDLFVAQKIHEANPSRHVDVGSRVDGFIAHVASFRTIEVLDIRALQSSTANIVFTQADLMDPAFQLDPKTPSLSCLHAIEHFGLGRYGDLFDLDGHRKGFANLARCLEPGGTFYFSTPVGRPRIEFNAHRVFSLEQLQTLFTENELLIKDWAYVDDKGDLNVNVALNSEAASRNFGLEYGCGIFVLTKKIQS